MEINKKEHKALLWNLFYGERKNQSGNLELYVKKFPLEELADAGSAKKKLKENSREENGLYLWEDGIITFSPAEAAILQKEFKTIKEWEPDLAETVDELKLIFNPKA